VALAVVGKTGNANHEPWPRNAPPLFNLGARKLVLMFFESKAEVDETKPSDFRRPASEISRNRVMIPYESITSVAEVKKISFFFPLPSHGGQDL
jgi:hypothetical protein